MKINEVVSLNDVLKADQYVTLLKKLKIKADNGINVTGIKNKIIQSWKTGMKSRKHFNSLLGEVNLNLNDLIDE